MSKPVILTGLRANNDLHIGNYFGALLPMIDMAKNRADEFQVNLFVPDLHSFTTPIDHSQLHGQILHNLKLYVAAGLPLDHPDIHIYRQSYVPAHSELTWILSCFTGFGEMGRMIEFKEKTKRLGGDRTSVGLFTYPILQAADILLYHARYIPVGEDQRQHIEYATDIAERMNNRFGELFTIPATPAEHKQLLNNDQSLRIKDLVEPTRKMSKSDETGKGVIFLGDRPEDAAKKIKSATTDSLGKINVNNPEQAGIHNLLQILALTTGRPLAEIYAEYDGQEQYGPLKSAVADAVSGFLVDFQTRLSQVDEARLMVKLEADEKQMNETANATLLKVQKAVGLRA